MSHLAPAPSKAATRSPVFVGGIDSARRAELGRVSVGVDMTKRDFAAAFVEDRFSTSPSAVELVKSLATLYATSADARAVVYLDMPTTVVEAPVRAKVEYVPIWLANVNDPEASTGPENMALTVHSLLDQLADMGLDSVDLGKVERTIPSPRHVVAVLRSSFSMRQRIKGWADLQRCARERLEARGIDVSDVMRGLDR